MNPNTLVVTVEATHQSLQQRLDEATRARRGGGAPAAGTVPGQRLPGRDEPPPGRRGRGAGPRGGAPDAGRVGSGSRTTSTRRACSSRPWSGSRRVSTASSTWRTCPGRRSGTTYGAQLTGHNEKELELVRALTADLDPDGVPGAGRPGLPGRAQGPHPRAPLPSPPGVPRSHRTQGVGGRRPVLGHRREPRGPATGPAAAEGPQPREPAVAVPRR